MPNLLAHYGVQGPLSRGTLPAGDLKWILTGCLLPDIPWILQRAVKTLFPGAVNPYDLRMGDEIYPRNVDLDRSASVSIQGRFVSPDTVAVTGLHQHRSGLRDLSSYVGIAVLVIVWWRAVLQQFRKSVERRRRSARET